VSTRRKQSHEPAKSGRINSGSSENTPAVCTRAQGDKCIKPLCTCLERAEFRVKKPPHMEAETKNTQFPTGNTPPMLYILVPSVAEISVSV